MTNRIGPVDQGNLGKIGSKVDETSAATTLKPNAAPSDKSGSDASNNDTVNLTSSAKLLERVDKTLAAMPDVNAQRVSELRQAIESGDYDIDTDAIATAMVQLDRSLGN